MSHGSRVPPIRAFFAVDLDDAARAAAVRLLDRLRDPADGVRWVRPEALHVTLRFLGDIDPAQVTPLARSVAGELAGLSPFRMELGQVQLFPSPRRPRVVALEVEPAERLAELAGAVERGTRAEGFEPEERAFRAHLTLGRLKPRGRARRGAAPAEAGAPATRGLGAKGAACDVAEVVLFRSELRSEGAKYTALERMPLGGCR
jgi:2'-5' RNA ligase